VKAWAVPFLIGLIAPAAAAPAKAQSPAPSTPASIFDGTYIGVSADNVSAGGTLSGGRARTQGYAGARTCPDFRAPAPLTITGGHAQARWGERMLDGKTAPDGSLTMTTGHGQKFEGHIDGQLVKGQLIGYCAYSLAWRKRS
jgi:hypothetical protein